MKTYLVFEPVEGERTVDAADRILFVREKFYWTALFLAPLWLVWHQLWLGLLGWIGATGIIALVAWALALDQTMAAIAGFAPSLIVALEGIELRRRKLLRSGFRDTAVVVAADLEDAERRFFDGWAGRAKTPLAQQSSLPLLPRDSIVGLFPEPGASR